MSIVKSSARSFSKLTLERSIQGDGYTGVAIVLLEEECVKEFVVVVVLAGVLGGTIALDSVVVVVVVVAVVFGRTIALESIVVVVVPPNTPANTTTTSNSLQHSSLS